MSTRALISRTIENEYRAVYHHYDGYPTGLGKTLFDLYRGHFNRDLHTMIEYLIDNEPVGWSSIQGYDFDEPKGWDDPDEAIVYSQGPQAFSCRKNEEPWNITSPESSHGQEWEYHFLPASSVMEIYKIGNYAKNRQCVEIVDLYGDEPDWEAIQNYQAE